MVDYVESLYGQATEAGAQAQGQGEHLSKKAGWNGSHEYFCADDGTQISNNYETRRRHSTRNYKKRLSQ